MIGVGKTMTDNVEFEGIDSSKTRTVGESLIESTLSEILLELRVVNLYLSILTNEEITDET